MHFSTLDEWLHWIGTVHARDIELGLDRIRKVARRLDILTPSCKVIIVGGTNGKGSTVAGLTSIYRAAGYHVGAFTSPMLFKFNEQIQIDGISVSDGELITAFQKIEETRDEITLTPFEYHTLAALLIFKSNALDLWILEVGLGGRLDAVNIIDADVSVVTSISIDHKEWLGDTREKIAYEKAGIYRKDKLAVCGDENPPLSLKEQAGKFCCQGKDFYYTESADRWSWSYSETNYDDLPQTKLAVQNMSTVLMAVTLLQNELPVTEAAIKKGLAEIELTGRIQIVNGPVTQIYDVAHNPGAMNMLKARLKKMPCAGKTHAVFSMLAEKDIIECLSIMREVIDDWYIAPLTNKRAASMDVLQEAAEKAGIEKTMFLPTILEAYDQATNKAEVGDRIVIFGSFHTVAELIV